LLIVPFAASLRMRSCIGDEERQLCCTVCATPGADFGASMRRRYYIGLET
jgi:hypothetical protein